MIKRTFEAWRIKRWAFEELCITIKQLSQCHIKLPFNVCINAFAIIWKEIRNKNDILTLRVPWCFKGTNYSFAASFPHRADQTMLDCHSSPQTLSLTQSVMNNKVTKSWMNITLVNAFCIAPDKNFMLMLNWCAQKQWLNWDSEEKKTKMWIINSKYYTNI